MASIESRAGGWRVIWRTGGRDSRKQSATFHDAKLANSAKQLIEARNHQVTSDEVYTAIYGIDRDDSKPVPTLAEWSKTWIAQRRESDEVQSDTVDDEVRIIIRNILPHLGQLPLTAVNEEAVRGWVRWLVGTPTKSGKPRAPKTVRNAHGVLHSLLAGAIPQWLDRNPAGRRPGAGRQSTGLPKAIRYDAVFLTGAEVDMIWRNCPPPIKDLVYVAVRTGLRLGELIELRAKDVTATGPRKVVQVRRARKRDGKIGGPKSRRSVRDVSISADVAEVLLPRVKGQPREQLVFTSPMGKAWRRNNLLRRYWAPAVAAARRCPEHPPSLPEKKKYGPPRQWRVDEVSTCDCSTRLHRVPRIHDLRHTHVSLCMEAGWDLVRVSRRIGHESIKTTVDLYGHLWGHDPDDRLDAIERLLLVADDEDDGEAGDTEQVEDDGGADGTEQVAA